MLNISTWNAGCGEAFWKSEMMKGCHLRWTLYFVPFIYLSTSNKFIYWPPHAWTLHVCKVCSWSKFLLKRLFVSQLLWSPYIKLLGCQFLLSLVVTVVVVEICISVLFLPLKSIVYNKKFKGIVYIWKSSVLAQASLFETSWISI